MGLELFPERGRLGQIAGTRELVFAPLPRATGRQRRRCVVARETVLGLQIDRLAEYLSQVLAQLPVPFVCYGAKLLHAFGEAVVPRVTLVTRKSYGGAYIAMNSRALGATRVFAWPEAEVAVMGAEPAVGILHRKLLAATPETERDLLRARLIEEHRRAVGDIGRALTLGVLDEVIEPEQTRQHLAAAFAAAPKRRGMHGNIPL